VELDGFPAPDECNPNAGQSILQMRRDRETGMQPTGRAAAGKHDVERGAHVTN
jgi:hypothetical protein